MNFDEALRDIETHEFAARVNVASDLRTFLRVLRGEQSVKIASVGMSVPDRQQQVLARLLRLTRVEVDLRYENPWDTALRVYLWLLALADVSLARLAAAAALHTPQYWWVRGLARAILSENLPHGLQTRTRDDSAPPVVRISFLNTDVGQSILWNDPVRKLGDARFILYEYGEVKEPGDGQAMVTAHAEGAGYPIHSETDSSIPYYQEGVAA